MRKLVFLLTILSGAYFEAPTAHACPDDLLNGMKENPDLETAINDNPELTNAWEVLQEDEVLRVV